MKRSSWTHGILAALVIMAPCLLTPAIGQTREEIKQQAETRLSHLTPDEIDQRLKELGMTREEALQRAADYNISLDEYLSRTPPAEPKDQVGFQGDPRSSSAQFRSDPRLKTVPSLQPARRDSLAVAFLKAVQRKLRPVPGFAGRRGIDSLLQPFGQDLFDTQNSAFTPSPIAGAPPSYALGPGDEISLSVWGETRLNYQLTVNRDGNLVVPDVGPVAANGLTIQQFREKLLRRMAAIYSSLRGGAAARAYLDVSLGKLKSIQIYVLGEVSSPGGYSVPSMANALTAMYAAGGPTVDGSMRDIRVVRRGDSTTTLDLYQYILRGEQANQPLLQDGDVVFVRPAGKRAAIVGEILRPAIYELKPGETLGDLLALSGGPRFLAYINRLHVERITPFDKRRPGSKDIQDFDIRFSSLSDMQQSKFNVENGDVFSVLRIGKLVANRVTISGSVKNPGPYEFTEGMGVGDLILAADSLTRDAFAGRGTIFRTLPDEKIEILSFNPREAILRSGSENIALKNEDSVAIYREDRFVPLDSVSILGSVRKPGRYPLGAGMLISDLIVMAGGLQEEASLRGWEVSRMDTSEPGVYSRVFKLDVSPDYWNRNGGASFVLGSHDMVFVPPDPRFVTQRVVRLSGYLMAPGTYALRYEGERLSELFDRAGGLRQGAYLEGSRLIRSFNNAGLVPIDFRKAIEDRSSRDNVVLYPGDSVHVAFSEDVVYVTGEVIVPSPVLYKKGAGPGYYISQAGGYKQEADQDRAVTLLPGGKKWESSGFFLIPDPEVLPGSSIFVPKKIEKEDKTLPLIRDFATILASLAALTVALIQVTK